MPRSSSTGACEDAACANLLIARDVVDKKPVPKRITVQESVFPAEVAAKEFPNRKY